jgi:hypothetical protein
MQKRKVSAELIALLSGILAAFIMPIWAVHLAANKAYSGAVVFTTGLKNLGLGDMERGIGVCGIIGVVSALVVGLLVYSVFVWLKNRRTR